MMESVGAVLLVVIFLVSAVAFVTPFVSSLGRLRARPPRLSVLSRPSFRVVAGLISVLSLVGLSAIYVARSYAPLEVEVFAPKTVERAPEPPAEKPSGPVPAPAPSRESSRAAEPREVKKRDGVPAAKKAAKPKETAEEPEAVKAKEIKDVKAAKKNGGPPAKANGEAPKKYTAVTVFYGTDRNVTGDAHPARYYGETRGVLQVGTCQVSVPEDHRVGQLESPFIAKVPLLGRFRHAFEDPEKHVVLLSVQQKEKGVFLLEVKQKVEASEKREALVFIHGYNVTFEDSCRRTAQIAYDLKFSGAPIAYSWPSDGKTVDYVKDEQDIEWSTPNFEQFLVMMAAETGARTVHLIAHSMGNRALVRALAAIAGKRGVQASPLFNQVVLTAPDIDTGVFLNLARAVQRAAERTTLYASSNDEALKISKKIHGYPRLGEAGPNLTIIDGMDTVDVSTVDTSLIGHTYYGDNRSVITDLFELIRERKSPRERVNLRERTRDGLTYWEFRP